MKPGKQGAVWLLAMAWGLAGCAGEYGGEADAGNGGPSPGGSSVASERALFDARVQPTLDFCRTCHVPGGVADSDEGRRFMLATDRAQDHALLRASWEALGRGVDDNLILQYPSGQQPHSGGAPWPQGSAAYANMRILLGCWNDPADCAALLAGAGGAPVAAAEPLLGNPGKHYFINRLCDGAPDSTPIDWNQDPRRLLTVDGGLIDSEQYAVHFNDPYEICHTETLFETQARQNALRVAQGLEPIYSARPDPATCGEWRAAVQRGHDWVAMTPADQPLHGDQAGGDSAMAWNSLWRLWGMSERPADYDLHLFERYGHSPPPPHIYNPYPVVDPARGIDERPQLSATFGGSGRMPLGWAQGRDAEGRYNGRVNLTCFSCHAGQIGEGEVASRDGNGNAASYGANPTGTFMGLPNTNTELGVLYVDLINAAQYDIPGRDSLPLSIPAIGYIPLINTTRGTNAADTEIEAMVIRRDFDTLENDARLLTYPLHGNMGDQDPPAWWWLSNKTRYLWFGGHSTDSSRGNMYFGSVNELTGEQVKALEGTYEDVHQWSLTVEAPDYPAGYCSGANGEPAAADHPGCIRRPLAEQGAILFHEKDLWAQDANAGIPRPKGNGSCASCHGAYSPRFIADPRFLPTPALAGMVGYTVPIEIIDTDPAQAEGWAAEIREHVSTFWWSYPDAVEGYRLPEEKDRLTETLDDYTFSGVSGSDFADHLTRLLGHSGNLELLQDAAGGVFDGTIGQIPNLGAGEAMGRVKGACSFEEKTVGYVTPPLHGVWASAPYFHNGSVPNVWAVLDPDDRPKAWRRQRTTTPVHFNAFETRIDGPSGGYDWDKLGWKYDAMDCGDGGQGIPYYTCQPAQDVPPEIQWGADLLLGGLLWPTWVVPPPVGDQGLEDRMVFNTSMYSKKNRGHEWTRGLTDTERRALVEYLKTL
jgi:endo-cleaving rubber dioxygenase